MIDPDELRQVAADFDGEDVEGAVLERLSWRRRNGYRTCSHCHEDKQPSAFRSNATRADGLHHACRICERAMRPR